METIMNDEDVLIAFGEAVQRARAEKSWSQEKLGEISGLDRTYVSSVERGQRNISILNICKIARALGTTPSSLLSSIGG